MTIQTTHTASITIDDDVVAHATATLGNVSLRFARDRAMLAMPSLQELKAIEIADLHLDDALGDDGQVAGVMRVVHCSSNGVDCMVPMHPQAAALLEDLVRTPTAGRSRPVLRNMCGEPMSANVVSQTLGCLYVGAAVTSYNGRRTFIVEAMRPAAIGGGSLRRAQMLTGQRSITLTKSYLAAALLRQLQLVRFGSIF